MRNLNLLAIIISLFWMGSLQAQEQLPQPPQKFEGKIGKTYKDSKEDYPKELTPPAGAPNVIVIMLDDVGFGQPSVNGGPFQPRDWINLPKKACITLDFIPPEFAVLPAQLYWQGEIIIP